MICTALALSACGSAERIANIGKAPDMSPLVTRDTLRSQQPVALPMPAQADNPKTANSLWTKNKTKTIKSAR